MGRSADAVAEGVAISAAAYRLAIKNHILVETIAKGEDFTVDRFAPAARDILLGLAAEAEQAARLAKKQRKAAWGHHSQPVGTHDYRDRDLRNLRKRTKQYLGVAKELRARAADDEALRGIVEEARLAAWSDVSDNLERRLIVEGMRSDVDPDYARMRTARMQALRLVDLQRLAAQHRKKKAHARDNDSGESAVVEAEGA